MDLIEIGREMTRLDAVYRQVAGRPVEHPDLDTSMNSGARIEQVLARLGVSDNSEAVLQAAIALYGSSDEPTRSAIRRLFDRCTSFRWVAHLSRDWRTADEFRARLIHLSARDQGADTRDEILTLQDLCERARSGGIDVDPILDEVAALSNDVDRYGMGSMRTIILSCGTRRNG